jgi:hypothetical protein
VGNEEGKHVRTIVMLRTGHEGSTGCSCGGTGLLRCNPGLLFMKLAGIRKLDSIHASMSPAYRQTDGCNHQSCLLACGAP